jgi:hypothetical protein
MAASEGWVKEQPFIAGLAAAYSLSGLALLYSVVSPAAPRECCRIGGLLRLRGSAKCESTDQNRRGGEDKFNS